MLEQKNSCHYCKAQFFPKNRPICGTCDKTFCPNCSSCKCTFISKNQQTISKKIKSIELNKINTIKDGELLEISGTLSPLIGQKPIVTENGRVLKTEYEFSDETGKINLIVWGPVPEKIFPYRYEFSDLTIQGIKKTIFNGKPLLVVNKSTKFYLNTTKFKKLNYFLSEA